MDFIDLSRQQERIRSEIEESINRVLRHGRYVMGPEIDQLEETLAAYVGVKHAVGCSSGTDALLLALLACGIGPGDCVFTTPFTFIATAEVISLAGATPVFVDIDPVTFNMDASQLERAIQAISGNDPSAYPVPRFLKSQHGRDTTRLSPKGIVAVDLFGLPADYDRLNAIAEENGLFVIEDAAQSFGSEYKGRKAGALSVISCTSFFPAKPLGCYGDGGMCFTDRPDLARMMRSLRVHGTGDDKYDNVRIGINGRLDTIQAAILLAKFRIFPEEVLLRQEAARRYTELLNRLSVDLVAPRIPADRTSVWAQYSVLSTGSDHRSRLQRRLKDENIPTAVYYPKPLHLQKAFQFLGYNVGDFPVSEDCAEKIFSLPMHPYLKEADQQKICSVLSMEHI